MNRVQITGAPAKLVSALSLFVLGCILTAGLWPFHVARNGVAWLSQENGLRFAGHGAVVSAGWFRNFREPDDTAFTLELGLTPALTYGSGTFLAFDSSPDPRSPFKLSQFGAGLAVQRYAIDGQGKVHQFWFKVPDVFEANQAVFVTITSGATRTDLYLNGMLTGTSPDPGIASRELTGRMVVGDSTFDDSWKGDVGAVAIYGQELTAAEVSRHFQRWTLNRDLPSAGAPLVAVALYRFNERSGNRVRNEVDSATDLTIPVRYSVLHHPFLNQDIYPQMPGTWTRWSSWVDLGINIAGFIPVGFVFLSYFSSVKRIPRAALLVVIIGFLLSLTIEVSQWFLPNRDSGMADLLTNTTGTAIGVMLYRCAPLQTLWIAILQYLGGQTPVAEHNVSEGIRCHRNPHRRRRQAPDTLAIVEFKKV
jgi:VanZ family protein